MRSLYLPAATKEEETNKGAGDGPAPACWPGGAQGHGVGHGGGDVVQRVVGGQTGERGRVRAEMACEHVGVQRAHLR